MIKYFEDIMAVKCAYSCTVGEAKAAVDAREKDTRNYCTVEALHTLLKITYEHAYILLHRAGRKDNHDFYITPYLAEQSWAEPKFRAYYAGNKAYQLYGRPICRSLTQVKKDFPFGRYLLISPTHALALVNGMVYDNMTDRKRYTISSIWQIFPERFVKEMVEEISANG